jgi:hypothetical protein
MKHSTPEQLSKAIVIVIFFGITGGLALALIFTTAISANTILVLFGAVTALAAITFTITLIFRRMEHFLKMVPKYPWFQPPNSQKNRADDRLVVLTGRVLVGACFQLVAYLIYVTTLSIFFFTLGDPFSSEPAYLLWAAFSGALIARLSRYIPNWAERIATLIADFFVPFGVILSLVLWVRLGGSIASPQISGILAVYGPLFFMLFPLYLGTDATLQFLSDRGLFKGSFQLEA